MYAYTYNQNIIITITNNNKSMINRAAAPALHALQAALVQRVLREEAAEHEAGVEEVRGGEVDEEGEVLQAEIGQ